MPNTEIITALDIGSGKVTCVIAAHDEETGKFRVLGGARADSKGIKSGMVTSIEEAAHSIRVAVEAAEKRSGQVASEVLLGVRGPHLYSMDARGRVNISRTDQEITAEDVANVIDNSKAFSLGNAIEILHVVPQKYSLDRLPGVPDPIGMQGGLLEAETHMVLGSTPAICNLIKAVNTAGFQLAAEPVYTLLALGELVVEEEEKSLGTLLLDIGGQTTSMGIYIEGALHFSKELPMGGDSINKDLAHGLGTTGGWARELKEKYGAAYSSFVDKDKKLTIMKADRRTKAEISARDLLKYIQPRVEEIFELAYEAVQKSAFPDLAGGAILAGGGALLKGMPDAATELLQLPQARLAHPVLELLDCPEEYLAQPYLGAVALACYTHAGDWGADSQNSHRGGGQFRRLWQWVREMF
ncbi:MAG TPA: cell division protein FtsA [Elusimicrobia bacterium]|nr:MAG: cell division protein FtsA [Elusimicrobia bacterium GWD2_63_28]HBB68114.1 cell division protein FtsA [Elusimicrobiota bacterium]HCC48941.1 cell division protein FtsA [Elusimicrobiota bacterium]